VRGAVTTAASISRSGTPVNGLDSILAHTPSATEKIPAASTTKAGEKTDKPDSDNNIVKDAPSPNTEDIQADVGLVEEKEEVSKTVIDVPVPRFQPAATNESDNPEEVETNDQTNHSVHNHVNGVVEDEEKVDLKVQALETEETDKRQYVGDGSWEEKAWKELVRMREDMFWARIGGFRG
jgi:Rab guanine nucleotide exchange factor SEC2